MLRVRLACPFALLVLAALFPALAFALAETYEGVLKPDSADPEAFARGAVAQWVELATRVVRS